MADIQARKSEWNKIKIGDSLKIIRGISFPKDARKEYSFPKSIACLRTTNVQREVEWVDLWFVPEKYVKREEQLIKANDILISTANSLELVGKVAQVKSQPWAATLGAFISLIRVPSGVNPQFVYYQLSSAEVQNQLHSIASTTTNISNISTSKLSEIILSYPSLEEQNLIVTKIEELFSQLDAGVEGLKRVQELLKQYRASVLKAAFEGRLVPQDPNDEPVYDSLKKVGITPSNAINSNDIPENWLWIKLGDITNTTSGGTPLRNHPEYYGGYIPWLKSGELNDSLLSSTDEYISELGLQKSSAKLFPAGTVVVALYGATVGRTGIMDFTGATNQAVCAVFPLHNLIEEKYLLYWLQSKRQYLISVSAGGAQPNISQGIIRNLEFPLAPINEQKRIISEIEYQLSIISQTEIDISTHVTKASKLRQTVLKAAFEGRLLEQGL